jgi:hypothetical protein
MIEPLIILVMTSNIILTSLFIKNNNFNRIGYYYRYNKILYYIDILLSIFFSTAILLIVIAIYFVGKIFRLNYLNKEINHFLVRWFKNTNKKKYNKEYLYPKKEYNELLINIFKEKHFNYGSLKTVEHCIILKIISDTSYHVTKMQDIEIIYSHHDSIFIDAFINNIDVYDGKYQIKHLNDLLFRTKIRKILT